jgi:long-subunit fatty acid transport protein
MARFSLAADYEWQEWSRYRGAHGERAGFDDAWRASAGGELRPLEHLTLLAGFGFRRSPVPAQTGRTNYVDDDKYVPSLGAIYEFRMEGKTIEIGLFSQLHLARGRSVEKAPADGASPPCGSGVEELCDEDPLTSGLQTSNPGFPGFSSGGWVWVSGAQVTWRYQ